MLTLAATQSSIWGYSAIAHTITGLTALGVSSSNTGSFTKPTLAPNGKLYSIMTCPAVTINGVNQTNVILEITPGNSNTKTTNYSKPTFNFIYPDPSVAAGASGFSKPSWQQGSVNVVQTFNTGILAPNGLIYFVPFDNQTATNKWVVFNPTSGQWKLMNIHPGYAEGGATYIPNAVITTAVLGTDSKMYVFGYGTSTVPYYRFTPSANALTDVVSIETGHYQNVPLSTTPLCNTNMQWKNSAGTSFTDTAVNTVTKAYDNGGAGARPYEKVKTFIDIIVHPRGRIYFIPGAASTSSGPGGRGRIFYLNIASWGTATELVSAAGLVAPGGKNISAHYAFLEKPRSADHDINTLKIYIVPAPRLGATATVCTEVLCINPVTDTITEIPFTFTTDTTVTTIGKRISLSNGLNIFYNGGTGAGNSLATDRSGGHILTGWDVPSSDTDGGKAIDTTSIGILHNTFPANFGETSPAFSLIGGGVNAPYPHHSKFIGYPGALTNISELVSVKEYGEGITNFNFEDRDKPGYAPPTNIGGLATSLFNMNFNKPK